MNTHFSRVIFLVDVTEKEVRFSVSATVTTLIGVILTFIFSISLFWIFIGEITGYEMKKEIFCY